MTVWRWRASGIPASLKASAMPLVSAFMPLISKTAGTWQAYMDRVDGQPGTRAIPAPNNHFPQDRYAVSADHRSSDAPPAWYPSVYFQHGYSPYPAPAYPAGGNDSGVCIFSDNQLPVPAIDPTRGTRRLGGGRVVQPYQEIYQRPPRHRRRVSHRHA